MIFAVVWWAWPLLALGLLLLFGLWWAWRSGPPREVLVRLLEERLSELQQEHFVLAAGSGKPRGLRWKSCEWSEDYELARQRKTRMPIALLGVTLHFEAVEGGDMEGLPMVGVPRNATAILFFDRGQWRTSGRMVLNLNPAEIVQQFSDEYDALPSG